MLQVHNSAFKYKCIRGCINYNFETEAELQTHSAAIHNIKISSGKLRLQQLLTIILNLVKSFACTYGCPISFTTVRGLTTHNACQHKEKDEIDVKAALMLPPPSGTRVLRSAAGVTRDHG